MENSIFISHRFYEDPLTIPLRTHVHNKWEFLFVAKGILSCTIEGSRYAVREGSLLVFKPAQIHRIQALGSPPYEYFSVMCEEEALSDPVRNMLEKSVGYFSFHNTRTVYSDFCEISKKCENIESSCDANSRRIYDFFETVFNHIDKNAFPDLLSEDYIVKESLSYITSNVNDIKSLDQICKAVGVTKEKLYNHFIQAMLISPMKCVRAKKAALAQKGTLNEKAIQKMV